MQVHAISRKKELSIHLLHEHTLWLCYYVISGHDAVCGGTASGERAVLYIIFDIRFSGYTVKVILTEFVSYWWPSG